MMPSASFTPTTCAGFTAAALLPAALPVPLGALLAVFLILSVLAVLMEGGWRSVRTAAIWMLPISLPLLAVHGIVNPAFPVSDTLAGFLPIRHDGLIFAISLAVKLGLFALGVSVWRCVSRDQVFSALGTLASPSAAALDCRHAGDVTAGPGVAPGRGDPSRPASPRHSGPWPISFATGGAADDCDSARGFDAG
jgi:hypothetical protein